jgi:hypothetical protein
VAVFLGNLPIDYVVGFEFPEGADEYLLREAFNQAAQLTEPLRAFRGKLSDHEVFPPAPNGGERRVEPTVVPPFRRHRGSRWAGSLRVETLTKKEVLARWEGTAFFVSFSVGDRTRPSRSVRTAAPDTKLNERQGKR